MGDALRERDPEAVRLTVAHALLLREGLPEPVKEGREESEGDTLGDALTELHSDSLGLAVLLGLWEALRLPLWLPLEEDDKEGLPVTLTLMAMFVPECAKEALAAAELVLDTVVERDGVPVLAILSDGEVVEDVEKERHSLALLLWDAEGLFVVLAE